VLGTVTIHKATADADRQVVSLIPMAGRATRISPLPFSKELYPIGFRIVDKEAGPRPKVVAHYLLEKMRVAGISRVFIVLAKGKWDIPDYFGDGSFVDVHCAYLVMRYPFGPSCSMDQAFPFIRDSFVAFGFPDILFQPDDAYVQLLERQRTTHADVVLGILPAHNPQEMDMVDTDGEGNIINMIIKPTRTHLRNTWICAVWGPAFTRFMHEYIESRRSEMAALFGNEGSHPQPDLSVGAVIQAAIRANLRVNSVLFPHGTYVDIGTPEGLAKAVAAAANAPGEFRAS
jgi:glucose-1-phosphate thymidylyltransferase